MTVFAGGGRWPRRVGDVVEREVRLQLSPKWKDEEAESPKERRNGPSEAGCLWGLAL